MGKKEYKIEFAPDGIHFQKIKIGKIEDLWDYFCFGEDITIQKYLNPFAKFRLVNEKTLKVIGVK